MKTSKDYLPDSSYKSALKHFYPNLYLEFQGELDQNKLITPMRSPDVLPKKPKKKLSISYKEDPLVKEIVDKYISAQKDYFENKRKEQLLVCKTLMKYADSLIKSQAALYYKNNNLIIILDTSTTIDDKEKVFNAIAVLSGEMYVLKRDLDNYQRRVSDLEKEITIYKYDSFFAPIDSVASSYDKINKDLKKFNDDVTEVQGKLFNSDTVVFRHIIQDWNKIVSNVLPSNRKNEDAKQKETELGALPGLSSIVGQREVNFNLAVLGFQKVQSETSAIYGEIKLFTSSIKTDSVQNLRTLFLPEASSFGVTGKINIALGIISDNKIKNQKRFGINLEFNLLGKKLKPDNSNKENSFNPIVFHTKTGFEFIAVKNILSIYTNVNTLTIFDNVKNYKTSLNTDKVFRGFIDFGTRMLLAPSDNSLSKLGLKLKIDLGFIANGGDIKAIIKSDDLVVPTFKFGLQKDFKL